MTESNLDRQREVDYLEEVVILSMIGSAPGQAFRTREYDKQYDYACLASIAGCMGLAVERDLVSITYIHYQHP